jgi:hypothetical protein
MKRGDKIVCIHTKQLKFPNGDVTRIGCDLEEGKIYTVDHLYYGEIFEEVVLVGKPGIQYSIHRFLTLDKYRNLKMNRIKQKINI